MNVLLMCAVLFTAPKSADSYEKALEVAEKKNKNVLLYFTADWCGWCKKMEKDTFSKREVKRALKNYVIYVVDTDEEKELKSKYGVRGIPAFRIVTHKEKVLKSSSGYQEPKKFLNFLKRWYE